MQSIYKFNDNGTKASPYKLSYFNYEKSSCSNIENISELVSKTKARRRKKYKVYTCSRQALYKSTKKNVAKHTSLPEINMKKLNLRASNSYTKIRKKYLHNDDKHMVNIACESSISEFNYYKNNFIHTKLIVYRCQMSTKEESCCCSCNSDAMFEVMKSLYDCYKKKNCNHCNCILCGHLPGEEREQAQARRSLAEIGATVLSDAEKKQKLKKALADMVGKSDPEKEKILRELTMANVPLPEPKNQAERDLINKVRRDLGLPPEPTNAAERAKLRKAEQLGIGAVPLEGKTPEQKEKLLRSLADRGFPLPEGRTPSERALIAKIRGRAPSKLVPSEKMRRAKAAGLITPLQGKTPEQKAKILKGLADMGIPFPEAKTPSEKRLMAKLRADLGLPREPSTPSMREKYNKAAHDGLLIPLEGKTPEEKRKILNELADRGIPLPEGRTPSEKALIANIKARPRVPSERLRKAKAAGLMTPLEGKTPEEKAKILKGLAELGIPLPEGKTPSEKKLITKIIADLGLPPIPQTPSMRDKYNQAAKDGVLVPLEGKTPAEKEKILRDLAARGIPLPMGRTPSEKAMIANINLTAPPRKPMTPSEKMRKAKAAGLLTPLKGKSPEDKERILRNLASLGLPLPEGKTKSERDMIMKVRADLGLPPEPRSPSMRDKYNKAANDGLLQPLEGKTPAEKERILNDLAARGIPLPVGRTASEKAMIANINLGLPPGQQLSPSERLRRAKDAGLITPLKGKSPEEKERILRNLGMLGLPLPEGKTKSERDHIMKIRADLGLPPEPTSPAMRDKYNKAANDGLLLPLEGKTPAEKEKILNDLAARGIPLPVGRSPSEKALIAKVNAKFRPPSVKVRPSERLRRAKDAGLITPLKGKTPEQKENIMRGLAMHGLPLPEGATPSEKKLADKIRRELGLPPEPKTPSMKEKYIKAANDGLLVPLEGKTPAEKKKILMDLAARGIPLPEGRTPSEKSLINKIKAKTGPPALGAPPSERLRRAKAAGLLTPLKGKTPEQKENILKGLAMHGLPLPEGDTPSEKKLVDKVRAELGLPPEPKTPSMRKKYQKAADQGLLVPLEGKTPAEKQKILKRLADMGLPLPEGRTPSEKALIADVKGKARPPSEGRPAQPALPLAERRRLDEKTAKGMKEPKGPSQECICDLLTSESERERISKILAPGSVLAAKLKEAKAAGLLTPLEGKTPEQKEKILKGLAKRGIPLPEAKTPSEKKILDKVREDLGLPPEPKTSQTKYNYAKAQAAGLITPLTGKTPAQKDKILRGLADLGVPLPVGRTPSEAALINAIKKGAPPPKGEPLDITSEKIRKAKAAGLLTPLEGKTPEQKEKILRGLAKAGFPLPEGKTPSDKALIRKIKSEFRIPEDTAAEKMRKARAAGLITPLAGKSPAQKEKILRGLAAAGLPLPEGKTPSEKALIKKVKADTGYLSPTPSERLRRAKVAGLLTPLADKTPEQKRKALRAMQAAGIPLPEGTTPSETEMIKQLALAKSPSEKLKDARAAGFLTPLKGKSPEQKEKIMRGLAKAGLPLPEATSASERSLANKIRNELGLPPEPRSPSLKEKYKKAQAAGIITPLEGKTPAQKERILKKMQEAGLPLPEGRTPSEKSMIKKLKAATKLTPAQRLKEAKAAGLLTPLQGKTPAQKERILRGLAKAGLPLPEGKTPSEKELIKKVRNELGLPPEPRSPSIRERMRKAQEAGILTPLEGKSAAQKEKILKDLAEAGIPLPEGRTASEKSLIGRIKDLAASKITPEKLRKAKAAGLLTPLEGKKPADKEKIVRGLADLGLPLPEGKTASEKSMINKIRTEMGIPPPAVTPSEKEVVRRARAEGLLTPLAGKSAKEKERILRGLADAGLPLPIGTTPSEKALIRKVRADAGLPLEPTPSEKRGKIKTKAKKIGVGEMKMSKAKAGGIGAAEFEDIVKTTKCDRGCGCDKKKIRFKHSYVKIRVTSPDFSSICSCPEECLPGIKGGVITDNEGIKVTVGSAIGVPSYSKYLMHSMSSESKSKSLFNVILDSDKNYTSTDTTESFSRNIRLKHYVSIARLENYSSEVYSERNTKSQDPKKLGSHYQWSYGVESDRTFTESYDIISCASNEWTEDSECLGATIIESFSCNSIPVSITLISTNCSSSDTCTASNISSIVTDSSLHISSAGFISTDVSPISSTTSTTDNDTCFCYTKSGFVDSSVSCLDFRHSSYSNELRNKLKTMRDTKKLYNVNKKQNEYLIFRAAQSKPKGRDPLVIINNIEDNQDDVMKMVNDLLTKRELSDTSLFLIVPSSGDSINGSSGLSSTIGIQDSENDLMFKSSESMILVKKHSSVDVGPKITELIYERSKNDRYFMDVSSSTMKENRLKCHKPSTLIISKNLTNNEQTLSPLLGKINKITADDKPTLPSTPKKKIKKKYFRQLLRNKHENNIADGSSTSESSVGKPPKRRFIKLWTKKSASPDRDANINLRKDVNAKNEFKFQGQLQLNTLYKSEKRKSHKRCQVSILKGEKRLAAVVPESEVYDGLFKNETNVFHASSGRDICPLHGIKRTKSSERDSSSIEELFRSLELPAQYPCPLHGTNRSYEPGCDSQPSMIDSRDPELAARLPCPLHGYRKTRDHHPIIEEDSSVSSRLPPNYYSSETLVGMRLINQESVIQAKPLYSISRSGRSKVAASQCDADMLQETFTVARAKKPDKKSDAKKKKDGVVPTSDSTDNSDSPNTSSESDDDKKKKDKKSKKEKKKKKTKDKDQSVNTGETGQPVLDEKGEVSKEETPESDKKTDSKGKTKSKTSKSSKKENIKEKEKNKKDKKNKKKDRKQETNTEGMEQKGEIINTEDGQQPEEIGDTAKAETTEFTENTASKGTKTGINCACTPPQGMADVAISANQQDELEKKLVKGELNRKQGGQMTKKTIEKKQTNGTQTTRLEDIDDKCGSSTTLECTDKDIARNGTKLEDARKNHKCMQSGLTCECGEYPFAPCRQLTERTHTIGHKEVNTEAPENVLDLGRYHELELLYIRDVMKMFSECSQTISGFRLNVLKKSNDETMPTCEEMLKFYRKYMKKRKPLCARMDIKNVSCGCSSCGPVGEEFKGLKVALGPKGHASKGLSGILCFNIQTDLSINTRISSFDNLND